MKVDLNRNIENEEKKNFNLRKNSIMEKGYVENIQQFKDFFASHLNSEELDLFI